MKSCGSDTGTMLRNLLRLHWGRKQGLLQNRSKQRQAAWSKDTTVTYSNNKSKLKEKSANETLRNEETVSAAAALAFWTLTTSMLGETSRPSFGAGITVWWRQIAANSSTWWPRLTNHIHSYPIIKIRHGSFTASCMHPAVQERHPSFSGSQTSTKTPGNFLAKRRWRHGSLSLDKVGKIMEDHGRSYLWRS